MANANEVGTIGQMYEHRKTHKAGVLESRDEKFKTLMFRDAEGKSFNVTYSTFHSAWRKYAGDASIQTSTQKEEEKSQKKEKVDKAEKVIKKSTKDIKPLSLKAKIDAISALETLLNNEVEKRTKPGIMRLRIKRTYKGGIKAYGNRHNVFEFWILSTNNRFDVYLSPAVSEKYEADEDIQVTKEVNDGGPMCIRYTYDRSKLNAVVKKTLNAFYNSDASKVQKEEKNKVEEK